MMRLCVLHLELLNFQTINKTHMTPVESLISSNHGLCTKEIQIPLIHYVILLSLNRLGQLNHHLGPLSPSDTEAGWQRRMLYHWKQEMKPVGHHVEPGQNQTQWGSDVSGSYTCEARMWNCPRKKFSRLVFSFQRFCQRWNGEGLCCCRLGFTGLQGNYSWLAADRETQERCDWGWLACSC